jgi:hypothetical protein
MPQQIPVSPLKFVLLLAAVILFILQALGVGDNDTLHLGWLGLALGFGSFIVP